MAQFVPRERIPGGVEEQNVFLNGRWVTGTGDDDEYVKKSISSDGLYSPEESGVEVAGVLQPILKLLEPRSRSNVEEGNVQGGCMRSWRGELRGSGSGLERDTRGGGGDEGGRRRQEMTTGGESKRIYVRRWEGVRRMSKEELVRLAKDESSHVYVVYGGRVMTPETINRLKDDAIVRVVDRMMGGGRKKKAAPRNKGESNMSATDESSSSTLSSERLSLITGVNEVFGSEAVEQMKTIAYNGQGGWVEAWARKIMEVGEEKEEEVLGYLCGMARVECGDVGAETMIGEIRKFIREQRRVEKDRRMKDEQEERRQRWEKDGEIWEPAGRETGKETAEDARGDEPAVVEETSKEERESECPEDGSGRRRNSGRKRKSSNRRRSGGSKRRLSRRRRGSSSKRRLSRRRRGSSNKRRPSRRRHDGSNGSKKKQQGSNDSRRRKKCGGSKSIRKRRPGEKANEGGRGSRTR